MLKNIMSLDEVAGEDNMADQLLSAPPLSFTITHKDIVSSFSIPV